MAIAVNELSLGGTSDSATAPSLDRARVGLQRVLPSPGSVREAGGTRRFGELRDVSDNARSLRCRVNGPGGSGERDSVSLDRLPPLAPGWEESAGPSWAASA